MAHYSFLRTVTSFDQQKFSKSLKYNLSVFKNMLSLSCVSSHCLPPSSITCPYVVYRMFYFIVLAFMIIYLNLYVWDEVIVEIFFRWRFLRFCWKDFPFFSELFWYFHKNQLPYQCISRFPVSLTYFSFFFTPVIHCSDYLPFLVSKIR